MPIYQITAPDGKKLRITAPEGATQEQVLAYAQKSYGVQQPEPPQRSMAERYAAAGIDPTPVDPTSGMTGVDKFVAGAGKSVMDTVHGAQQLFGQRTAAQEDETRRLDAPLVQTGAGMAGNIAGQAAQMAVPVPAGAALRATSFAGRAAPYVGAAARSGGFSALQGVGTGESRAANAGQGAALGVAGQGLASGAGAVARGAVSRLGDAEKALAQKAEGFGLKLGLPNISENPLVRTVASQMERLPFSGATRRGKANQTAFNRQVGETFGAKADRITPDVFAAAKTKLQNAFETLSTRNSLELDPGHVAQMKTVIDEATRLGGSDTARMVRGWANELLGKVDAHGSIPGKAYQSFDSRIAKQLKSGGESAHYLGMLRDAVRSAMDDSISAGDRAAWSAVRKQYAALKTVEPLVGKSATGNISPQALMGRVTSDTAGKARMATGKAGALGDLARIGQRFLKEAPNSGTADRALVNLAVGGGLYGAQQQGLISPTTAAQIGGGLLLNRLGLNALNSRALAAGDSRALTGLARLMQTAPRALPAAGNAASLSIMGGRPATPEDMANDAEIVRQFRAQQGR